jgi:hypothetical protein
MKRMVGAAAVAAVMLVSGTSAAWAETTLDLTWDSFVLGTDLAGDPVVEMTGTVECSTDDSAINEVQFTGSLWQPKVGKLGAGDFDVLFECSTGTYDFSFSGPFHPGRALFRVTAYACDETTSETCEATKVEFDSGTIPVRITK